MRDGGGGVPELRAHRSDLPGGRLLLRAAIGRQRHPGRVRQGDVRQDAPLRPGLPDRLLPLRWHLRLPGQLPPLGLHVAPASKRAKEMESRQAAEPPRELGAEAGRSDAPFRPPASPRPQSAPQQASRASLQGRAGANGAGGLQNLNPQSLGGFAALRLSISFPPDCCGLSPERWNEHVIDDRALLPHCSARRGALR